MSRKKIFISFLVFLGVVAVVFAVSAWNRSQVGEALDIEIKGPQQVLLGVPFDITVTIANKSRSVLQQSRLTVTLPPGAVFVGSPSEKNNDFRELGSLGPGSVSEEPFQVMITQGENVIKQIAASLSYLPSSIGSRFEKTGNL